MHQLQHQIAPLQAGARVVGVAGAVAVGAREQTHQKGRLAHIQSTGRLAEVQLCRLLESLRPQPQIGAIEIQLEDLVLAEAHLQLQRHPQLPQLAGEAEVAPHIRVHHARHLLGEAATATTAAQGRAHGAEQIQAAVPAEARLLRGHQRLAQVQRIALQGGQRRGGALLRVNLLATGREDLHRAGDAADPGPPSHGGRRQHRAHQQCRTHQAAHTQPVHGLLQRTPRVPVAQHRRITLQRRAEPHRIAIAQLDRANAAVAMEETIGGIEVLEGDIAIADPRALKNGVHPAHAGHLHRQLTGGIPADADPFPLENQAGEALIALPELGHSLTLAQLPPGLRDRLAPAAGGSAAHSLQELAPGLTPPHRRGGCLAGGALHLLVIRGLFHHHRCTSACA